ncbi:MAG: alpha-L-fucosidase [Armatimonadetes bacterium]|nr:alpha-L-fucosidase [Armatimonadota bacterium]
MREDVFAHSTGTGDKPEWLRERLKWFQSLKFGIILHWGVYSFWDCCESWPLVPDCDWSRRDEIRCWTERNKDIDWFQRDYRNLHKQFNPTGFDPDQWANLFVEAGAKYVCFTTKHHDGFCMWDTETTDYKITGEECPFHTNPNADVTKALFESCRRAGLAVSVYFSKADWHCPYYWSPEPRPMSQTANTVDDPETWEKFVQYTHRQIRELMTNYGKVDILWLDAGWVRGKEDIRMAEMVAMARELQPGLIVANRAVGDEFEDFVTPEREIPDDQLPDVWEACLPLGPDWKYVENQPLKSAAQVVEEIETANRRGGNFLLGIGPKYDGTIPDRDTEILLEIGRLRRN